MIALRLSDKKTFMNQLLCSEIFDRFLLLEASVAKEATFSIDGRINASLYTKEELDEQNLSDAKILPYAKLRPICYQLIRGSHTPVSFKFILMLSPQNTANTLLHSESGFTESDIKGIFLNLTFQNGQLLLTTGISYASFSMDHTLDQEWDLLVKKFLDRKSVV